MRRPSDLAREGRARPNERIGRGAVVGDGWPGGFAASPADRQALLVLLGLASLTPRRLLELSRRHPTATACLAAVRAGEAGSEGDRRFAEAIDPEEVKKRLDECAARLVTADDDEYPHELLDLFDPPAGLFVRGRDLSDPELRLAVVGARNCSPAGREIAGDLCRALSDAGVCVVSGGARGIDAAAHRGALLGGGLTMAVLGSGIDVAYPRQNQGLLERIADSGSIVSEYPPATPPEPFRFPARNRIVAGLCRGVVVVEGGPGSGSMITADHALDLGRDVFAVPGAITSELAAVPLALLREGAVPIRGSQDLLDDLGLSGRAGPTPHTGVGDRPSGGQISLEGPAVADLARASPSERAVWTALTTTSTPDRLAGSTGLPLPDVVSALVSLELQGRVRRMGGLYERRPGCLTRR
jgi:DNA processing protein